MKLPLVGRGQQTDYELVPGKIIGVGRNYRAHAAEMNSELPTEPLLFLMNPAGLVADGGSIWRPATFERVDYEGELGVVIATRASGVSPETALQCVLGYTCVNDVTIRDLQKRDKQWTRAKGFDTSCPTGPRIVSDLDPQNLELTTHLNGVEVQRAHTSQMVFTVAEIIAYISEYVTLEAGDLIATGTPAGVGNLVPGDEVAVTIKGIGTLTNRVVGERPAAD